MTVRFLLLALVFAIRFSLINLCAAQASSQVNTPAVDLTNWAQVHSLGEEKLKAGKLKAAEKYLNLARSLAQKDISHPENYLATLEDLGKVHEMRGHYWQAYHDFDEVFTARCKNTKDGGDEKLAQALDQIGRINYLLGNLTIAQQQLTESSDMFAKLAKRSLPEARALDDFSRVSLDFNKVDAAHSAAQSALEINEKLAGASSLPACRSLITLSKVALYASQFEQAEKLMSQAMLLATGTSRDATLTRAECLETCAQIYLTEGRLNQAINVGQEALALREKICGEEHPLTIDSMTTLATIYLGQKDFDSAGALLKRSLEITSDQFGLDSMRVAKLRLLEGTSALLQGANDEAKLYFSKSADAAKKAANQDNPDVRRILQLNHSFDQLNPNTWEVFKSGIDSLMGVKKPMANIPEPTSRSVDSLITKGTIVKPEEALPKPTANGTVMSGNGLWALGIIVIPLLVLFAFAMISGFMRSFARNDDRKGSSQQTPGGQPDAQGGKTDSTGRLMNRFADSSRKVNKFWDINQ